MVKPESQDETRSAGIAGRKFAFCGGINLSAKICFSEGVPTISLFHETPEWAIPQIFSDRQDLLTVFVCGICPRGVLYSRSVLSTGNSSSGNFGIHRQRDRLSMALPRPAGVSHFQPRAEYCIRCRVVWMDTPSRMPHCPDCSGDPNANSRTAGSADCC